MVKDTAPAPTLISIILPTRNEAGNIEPLLQRLEKTLAGQRAEVIFVDDSSDNTPAVIQQLAAKSLLDVRVIARPPERRTGGLGGAVVEGFRAAKGQWMLVMDADLQHPPETILKMLAHADKTGSDMVIASRFAEGASTPGLDQMRQAISYSFILSARVLFPKQLKNVTDPLTGFFMVRRNKIDLSTLKPNGFKILLEMLVQYTHLKVSEIGFTMAAREHGDSKASVKEVARYYRKLVELRFNNGGALGSSASPLLKKIDARFAMFVVVGVTGLIVNNLALVLFKEVFKLHYLLAAGGATQISTTWNFLLTEFWVFGDRRNQGNFLKRIVGFFLINNVLLLLRTPMMSLMVESLHSNYVVANMTSLATATLLRYVLADKLLWAKPDGNKSGKSNAAEIADKAQPAR